ncbi:MAG: energy-coupling factor transporter transmembrane component T family protein [Myxococcota bacterium]
MDPRFKILYVLAAGITAFVTANGTILLSLLGLQIVLWFAAGLSAGELLRAVRRLLWFVAFIVVSYAFFAERAGDQIVQLALWDWTVPVNLTGVGIGLLRASRIVTIILAAQVVQRSGDGAGIVAGLRRLHAPPFLAYGLDLVLAALGGPEAARGGRRKRQGKSGESGFSFRRLLRGDVGLVGEKIQLLLAQTRARAGSYALAPAARSDLVMVGALAILAMSLRLLKVMPGLPVAPGHKGIVLIPLYICAATLTRARWGGTRYGLVVGVTSFLLGMGKFGPFDILRHLAPGVFVDLVTPIAGRVFRNPGALVYGLIGVGAAATRITALAAAAVVVEAPPAFYAFLAPMVVAHMSFGFLSGAVTVQLLKWLRRLPEADLSAEEPAPE